MECPVCYETAADDKYQTLECTHSLCKLCLSRLRQRICPLCRAPIKISYRRQLLPTAADDEFNWSPEDIEWERVNSYEFEFSVEVRTTRLSRRRRRRNRSGRNRGTQVGLPRIPIIISDANMADMSASVSVPSEEPTPVATENDHRRQKTRYGRHQWREDRAHMISRYSGR